MKLILFVIIVFGNSPKCSRELINEWIEQNWEKQLQFNHTEEIDNAEQSEQAKDRFAWQWQTGRQSEGGRANLSGQVGVEMASSGVELNHWRSANASELGCWLDTSNPARIPCLLDISNLICHRFCLIMYCRNVSIRVH